MYIDTIHLMSDYISVNSVSTKSDLCPIQKLSSHDISPHTPTES